MEVGATATTTLTVRNDGDEGLDIGGLFSSSGLLIVDDTAPFHLGPGDEQVRTLRWTPMTTDSLVARLDLLVVARPPVTAAVPVVGVPSYGRLALHLQERELGDVAIGCARDFSFSVSNNGIGELSLESVTLSGPEDFVLEVADGAPTARVLAPNESVAFDATFIPTVPGHAEATLHVESDDIVHPVIDHDLSAFSFAVPGEVTLSWTVPPRPTALASVIAVNADVASSMREAFDAFFEVLRDSGVPFRAAIIGDQSSSPDPSVAGPYAYIDDALAVEESEAAVDAMLDGIGGDEDRSLALLESALEAHRDWLLGDDDALWQSSTLHLTAVNIDDEQSPLPARTYVDAYVEYKDGAAPIFVNGVAGPPPGGCAGGPGAEAAQPSQQLLDATRATAGVFLSICDDWTDNLAALAAHMALPMLFLDDAPVDSSLVVTLDGEKLDSGWVYDPQANAIRFDEESYPAAGSVVGVGYGRLLECE